MASKLLHGRRDVKGELGVQEEDEFKISKRDRATSGWNSSNIHSYQPLGKAIDVYNEYKVFKHWQDGKMEAVIKENQLKHFDYLIHEKLKVKPIDQSVKYRAKSMHPILKGNTQKKTALALLHIKESKNIGTRKKNSKQNDDILKQQMPLRFKSAIMTDSFKKFRQVNNSDGVDELRKELEDSFLRVKAARGGANIKELFPYHENDYFLPEKRNYSKINSPISLGSTIYMTQATSGYISPRNSKMRRMSSIKKQTGSEMRITDTVKTKTSWEAEAELDEITNTKDESPVYSLMERRGEITNSPNMNTFSSVARETNVTRCPVEQRNIFSSSFNNSLANSTSSPNKIILKNRSTRGNNWRESSYNQRISARQMIKLMSGTQRSIPPIASNKRKNELLQTFYQTSIKLNQSMEEDKKYGGAKQDEEEENGKVNESELLFSDPDIKMVSLVSSKPVNAYIKLVSLKDIMCKVQPQTYAKHFNTGEQNIPMIDVDDYPLMKEKHSEYIKNINEECKNRTEGADFWWKEKRGGSVVQGRLPTQQSTRSNQTTIPPSRASLNLKVQNLNLGSIELPPFTPLSPLIPSNINISSDAKRLKAKKLAQIDFQKHKQIHDFEKLGGYGYALHRFFNGDYKGGNEVDSVSKVAMACKTFYKKKENIKKNLLETLDAINSERPYALNLKKKNLKTNGMNKTVHSDICNMRLMAERDRLTRYEFVINNSARLYYKIIHMIFAKHFEICNGTYFVMDYMKDVIQSGHPFTPKNIFYLIEQLDDVEESDTIPQILVLMAKELGVSKSEFETKAMFSPLFMDTAYTNILK